MMGVDMEWISVTDRLPDSIAYVLVAYENGTVERDCYSNDRKDFVFKRGGEVTHWMPYPPHPGNENEVKPSPERVNYKNVIETFNRICTDLPKVRDLTEQRRCAIRKAAERLEEDGGFEPFFERVHRSDFLCGRSGKWKCGFDWILKPANIAKIREGNYDNEDVGKGRVTAHSEYESMVASYIPQYKKEKPKAVLDYDKLKGAVGNGV